MPLRTADVNSRFSLVKPPGVTACQTILSIRNPISPRPFAKPSRTDYALPFEDPKHAANAVRAAVEIVNMTTIQKFNGVQLDIRAGIATGPVIAGSVGDGGRQSYSLCGNTVNLSARL
jgi:hypothetical protein